MNYFADQSGYYGDFGGSYIPEMLNAPIAELQQRYRQIIAEDSFQQEFRVLLRDFVGRPTPLYLANRFSKKIGAKIYFKREDLCHTGAHKINNTCGQILLAERLGKKRIICETGAGQHGVATATVCALRDIECVVYMGELDIERQAPNVARMRFLGAQIVPVTSGSKTLKDATNEAMRDWIANPTDTHYIIGSAIGPHPYPDMVSSFQSVISLETRKQLLEHEGQDYADYVIACVGGGSNAIGQFYHFLDESRTKIIGVEAAGHGIDSGQTAATLTVGTTGVLHGCKTMLLQSKDGQVLEAHSVSAGLDYPGVGPQHAFLKTSGRVQYVSITDSEALEAAQLCSRTEGIIPALESAHAVAYLSKMDFKPEQIVVLCMSGRGDKDMATYSKYLEQAS
jgi:tryptophan synthase beta chain